MSEYGNELLEAYLVLDHAMSYLDNQRPKNAGETEHLANERAWCLLYDCRLLTASSFARLMAGEYVQHRLRSK